MAQRAAGTAERNAATQMLLDFLFVAVQVILFEQGVYPAELFGRRRKYNIPVHTCRHPSVTSYLQTLLEELREDFDQNRIEKVIVPVLDAASYSVLCRFVFSFEEGELAFVRAGGAAGASSVQNLSPESTAQFESHLRSALVKLTHYAKQAGDRPTSSELTWDVVCHTSGVKPGQHWAAADGSERRDLAEAAPIITPIKDAADHSPVKVILYMERPS